MQILGIEKKNDLENLLAKIIAGNFPTVEKDMKSK